MTRISNAPFVPRFLILALLSSVIWLTGCYGVAAVATVGAVDVARDRRDPSNYWSDNAIEFGIRNAVRTDSRMTSGHNLSVVVWNGVVLLTGEIPTQREIDIVLEHAKQQEGTRQVVNRIELAGKSTLGSRSNDTWITSKVKSSLIASTDVDGTKIKVLTERGHVYLMGLVTRTEADAAVEITRSVKGVVRVIKVFEYV